VAFKRLSVAVGNLKEAIGEQLAPSLTTVAFKLTEFFKSIKENDSFVKFVSIASLVVAGILGVVAAINTAALAFAQFQKAWVAITLLLELNPWVLAITGLVALGAVIYKFSDEVLAGGTAAIKAFVTFVSEAFNGISIIIQGALLLSPSQIQVGLNKIKNAVSDSIDVAKNEYIRKKSELDKEKQSALAPPPVIDEKPKAQKRGERDLTKAENELIRLEIEKATKERIDLKKNEIEILKKLDTEQHQSQRQLLKQQLEENRAEQERSRIGDLDNRTQYQTQILAQDADYLALSGEQQAEYQRLYGGSLIAAQQNENEIRLQTINEKQKQEIAENNRFIKDKQKYGVAVASINKVLYSDEVKEFQESSNQMAQLSQSKNATLKSIGKAYALSNIAISTAEMATKAYSSLAGIPLIGPVLGGIAAAAAIAFGAERTADVLAANAGGIVPGSGPNQDSVSAFLTPGELVVPRQNYDEVVNAVASQRAGNGNSGNDVVAAKLDQLIGIVSQGTTATITTNNQNDPLLNIFEALNYYLEFRNFRLYGVNS